MGRLSGPSCGGNAIPALVERSRLADVIPRDTTKEAAALQLEIHRKLGPEGRLKLAIEMSELTRALAMAGLRKRRPDLGPDELHRELILQLYGSKALG
jgi:hypothetical protein